MTSSSLTRSATSRAADDCPNDARGWHLWSAQYPDCVYCGGDLRYVCLCGNGPHCPVHQPHPDEQTGVVLTESVR
jgi:hypothetical protein